MNRKLASLMQKLQDERSGRVIFVSHCILNENTRYLGGAFCPGANQELLNDILREDCGIVQMPCPEQLTWGGVLKRLIWLPAGTKRGSFYYLMKTMFPLFILYTNVAYSGIASRIVRMIRDYLRAGFEIVGIVGIDGSPTCGVNKTLDMKRSFDYIATLDIDSLDRREYNAGLYRKCLACGNGLFFRALTKKLMKKKITLRFFSLDLEDEMAGRKTRLDSEKSRPS